MPKAGHGRGAIAAIGLILLFAGVVGGAVLWVLADREPNKAAESFARAAPGCTTTLTFGEPGEFFVYEELSGVAQAVEGCQPSTLPGRAFTFTVTTANGTEVPRVEDTSMSYDLDVGAATSVARITIEQAGDYRINVLGDDPAIVAAVGGDPEADVEQLRRGAIAAAAGGVVLGLLLLWLAGRRSKRAATFAGPLDPGWGVTERDHARRAAAAVDDGTTWPPATTQVPVNPHAPDERRVAQIERPASASSETVAPALPGDPPQAAAEPGAAPVLPPPGDAASGDRDAPPTPRPDEDDTPVGTAEPVEHVEPVEPETDQAADDVIDGDVADAPVSAAVPDESEAPSDPSDSSEISLGETGEGADADVDADSAHEDGRVTPDPDGSDDTARPDLPAPSENPPTQDGSMGETSSDDWPGGAPVPDDTVAGRDDADGASSEDDTPPA
jgi:hypothetical protein